MRALFLSAPLSSSTGASLRAHAAKSRPSGSASALIALIAVATTAWLMSLASLASPLATSL